MWKGGVWVAVAGKFKVQDESGVYVISWASALYLGASKKTDFSLQRVLQGHPPTNQREPTTNNQPLHRGQETSSQVPWLPHRHRIDLNLVPRSSNRRPPRNIQVPTHHPNYPLARRSPRHFFQRSMGLYLSCSQRTYGERTALNI